MGGAGCYHCGAFASRVGRVFIGSLKRQVLGLYFVLLAGYVSTIECTRIGCF